MVNAVQYAPMVTTNGAGGFNTFSDGYIQGFAMDDPSIRNKLAGGVLSPADALPMWGGVGVYENVSGGANVSGQDTLGGVVGRATSLANLTGFSVFNQAHHMIQSVGSPVPMALASQSVHFYRLGSGARIPLPIDPALISLAGGLITQQVAWDFVNQKLIAAPNAAAALPVHVLNLNIGNSKTVQLVPATGLYTWNSSGSCALIEI